MFEIGFNEVEGHQVFVFDLSREAKDSEIYQMLAMGGGIYCSMHTEQTLAVSLNDEATLASPQFMELLSGIEINVPFILIDSGLNSTLTDEEMYAVFQHEVGHIVNGDPQKAIADDACGFYIQQEMEMAADAFAVGKVGAMKYLHALKRVLEFVTDQVHTVTGIEREKIAEAISNNADTNERFAAIERSL